MDRTAWIIIGICAALLGLNIYMGNNKKAETAPHSRTADGCRRSQCPGCRRPPRSRNLRPGTGLRQQSP